MQRFEVFAGTGRRQDWSDDDKARIVAERYELGATVNDVARHHAMLPQSLFGWRHLRRTPETLSPRSASMFVPAAG